MPTLSPPAEFVLTIRICLDNKANCILDYIPHKYKDEVLYDVAPMHFGHLLLGHPWKFDRKVTHEEYKNRYTLAMNKRIIVLTTLKPNEAYAEYKLREELLSIQEKERKENMSENKQKIEKHKIT
ncbi:hypothetical protein CR513_01538, partial [Mucuna pruriens]